ncbi:MAG: alpha/beta hydrolase family protein [bacterium]
MWIRTGTSTERDGMDADQSERLEFPAAGGAVSALWTPAARPIAVAAVAHGAGAGMAHPFMTGGAAGLAAGGVSVLRFNFRYMEARRRVPDRTPVLLDTWRAAIQELARRGGGLPMVMGGKSMGGRMASMLAAEEGAQFRGAALVFFGYPLHPAGATGRLRDAHLPEIRVPMLFIQGTRDALAQADLVEDVVRRLEPLARLHVVPDGDHSFHVRGAKRPDRDIGYELGQFAARYAGEIVRNGRV